MTSETSTDGVVLIVEDERDLADLYATWVAADHEVRTAYTGEQALELVDESVGAVLLDRRLPGISGDEVLEEIRERGYECPVAMVSAVDPDFDIVAMGFDAYLMKPVSRADLVALVDRLLAVQQSPETVRDYLSLVSKRDVLRSKMGATELAESDEYASLTEAIEAFERRIVSLAEAYLDDHHEGLSPKDRQLLVAERQALQDELDTLDPDDLLYDTAKTEVEKLDTLLEQPTESVDAKQRLLRAVKDGFVAKGFWVDERILHALNQILFDKDSDTLVVERQTVTAGEDLSGAKLIAVSTAVREHAAAHLQ